MHTWAELCMHVCKEMAIPPAFLLILEESSLSVLKQTLFGAKNNNNKKIFKQT